MFSKYSTCFISVVIVLLVLYQRSSAADIEEKEDGSKKKKMEKEKQAVEDSKKIRNSKDKSEEKKRLRCPVLENNEYNMALSLLQRETPLPMSRRNKLITKVYKKISHYRFERDVVHDSYLGKKFPRLILNGKIILPKHEIEPCVKSFYEISKGDGAKKLVYTLGQHYYGIGEKTIQGILNSLDSHRVINPRFDNKAPEKSITADTIMERHQIDLVDLRSIAVTINGVEFSYALSVLDVFSRFLWLRPVQDKKATTIATELYNIYIEFGSPKIVQSDQGSEFKGVVKTLCARLNTRLIYSRSHHPQSQGKDERSHQTWKAKLRRDIMSPNDNEVCDWVTGLPVLQRIYNEGFHSALGMSPYECFFGIKPHHTVNRLSNSVDEVEFEVEEEDVIIEIEIPKANYEEHLETLKEVRGKAKQQSDKSAEKSKKRSLLKNPPSKYNPGDKVFVKQRRKDDRVSRGGSSITGTKVIEGTVIESNHTNHRYKVQINGKGRKTDKKWFSVDNVTAKHHKEEQKKKKEAKEIRNFQESTTSIKQVGILNELEKIVMLSKRESHKGVHPMSTLLNNAKKYNLELHADNRGNGNCMFMAISDQLLTHGVSVSHTDLRTRLVEFLRENPTLTSPTTTVDLRNFIYNRDNLDWNNYLNEMRSSGTWGDNIMLIAAANAFNARIIIISSLENSDRIIIEPASGEPEVDLYLGHLHELHYISLMETSIDQGTSIQLCEHCGVSYSKTPHQCLLSDGNSFNSIKNFPLSYEETLSLENRITTFIDETFLNECSGYKEYDRVCFLAKDATSMVWTSMLQKRKQVEFEEEMIMGEYFLRVPFSFMDMYDSFREKLSQLFTGLYLIYSSKTVRNWIKESSNVLMNEVQQIMILGELLYLVTRQARDNFDEWLEENGLSTVETADELHDEF